MLRSNADTEMANTSGRAAGGATDAPETCSNVQNGVGGLIQEQPVMGWLGASVARISRSTHMESAISSCHMGVKVYAEVAGLHLA